MARGGGGQKSWHQWKLLLLLLILLHPGAIYYLRMASDAGEPLHSQWMEFYAGPELLSNCTSSIPAPSRKFANDLMNGCRVYVLDVPSEIASAAGIPSCDPENPSIWPYNLPGSEGVDGHDGPIAHYHSQKSAPYYVAQAVKNSKYAVANLDDADIVLVSDYCYWVWWQTQARSGQLDVLNPGNYLLRAAHAVLDLPKFNASNGRSFAYMFPDPNSIREDVFGTLLCSQWKDTIFPIVNEKGQICGESDQSGRWDLVVPHTSTVYVPEVDFCRRRSTFLYLISGCSDEQGRSLGMRLRHAAVQAFHDIAADVIVKCHCSVCPGHEEHSRLMDMMTDSRFCLVLAGDTQSSRRLTEVMITGCIPVFVAPAFHSLPLADYVDYNSIGYFFHVERAHWVVESEDADSLRLWRLYTNVTVNSVGELRDIHAFLRGVTEDEVRSKQRAVEDQRRFFMYEPALREDNPQAVDAILHGMCKKMRKDRATS